MNGSEDHGVVVDPNHCESCARYAEEIKDLRQRLAEALELSERLRKIAGQGNEWK